MAIYKGFSTIGQFRKFKLTDFELVKRDLLNQFQIRRGEVLHDATYGTIIWDLIFEQLTDELKEILTNDIQNILKNEPRVKANNIIITEYEHGLQVELFLTYVNTNQTDTLKLTFDNRAQSKK